MAGAGRRTALPAPIPGFGGIPIRPETAEERQRRHQASIAAFRALVDPANPPRKPFLFEHHFFAPEEADISGFQLAAEESGFRFETLAFDPDAFDRAWKAVVLKLDLLEERRILALSDEMESLGRRFGLTYDGWLTRVE